MVGDPVADYLAAVPAAQAMELARVNEPGLTALRNYLAAGQAIAFLGAGVSAPMYPLWNGLIDELVGAAATSQQLRQNADMARCDRLRGRLDLAAGDIAAARDHLRAAERRFRDGDYLTELAPTLADLASCALAKGVLDIAEQYAAEAASIAAPRKLMPAHAAALAVQARIRADQAVAEADQDLLAQGRDAADAALRIAEHHHLAWQELDAERAHAVLDRVEGADHGWAARAEARYQQLVPPGLNPDPLAEGEQGATQPPPW